MVLAFHFCVPTLAAPFWNALLAPALAVGLAPFVGCKSAGAAAGQTQTAAPIS